MLQAELERLNEEPSEQTELLNQESGTAVLSEELRTSLLEKQMSKLKNESAPEEEEEALDEKLQQDRSSDSHEGHASEGTSRNFRPG